MSAANSTHSCVFCNAKFESKEVLREHFREHANDREYSSNHEKKKKGFKSHVEDNTTGFKCDICGLTCRSKALLIVHRTRKHPEEAKTKYICSYCGRQFPLKMDWDNHLNSEHAEIKRGKFKSEVGSSSFICELCNRQFFRKGALEFHKSTNHNSVSSIFGPVVTPPPSNKIRVDSAGFNRSVYYCHLCGTEYINKFNLRKHLEHQHSETERNNSPTELIKCNFCCALFFNIKAYETHNLSHSANDHIVDGECERLETVSHTDLDFDFRRVRRNTTLDKLTQKEMRPASRRRKPHVNGNFIDKKSSRKIDDDEELSPPSDYGSSSDEAEEA